MYIRRGTMGQLFVGLWASFSMAVLQARCQPYRFQPDVSGSNECCGSKALVISALRVEFAGFSELAADRR